MAEKAKALQKSARIPFQLTKTTRDLVAADYDGDQWYQDLAFLNCYLVKSKIDTQRDGDQGQEATLELKKRPGWASNSTPAGSSDVPTAVFAWNSGDGSIMSAFGTKIYNDTNLEHTLGSGSCIFINETTIGSTDYLTFVASDNKAYYSTGAALTQITDADFPGQASNSSRTITGNFVHMDGFAFIMTTDGRIYNSDIDSITSYTSTGFISCNMYGDDGLGVIRYKNQIIGIGKQSMEFFTNVGNPVASPLQKNQSIALKIGCPNQHSFVNFDDTIYFLGNGDTSRLGLFYLDGYTPVEIKDPMLDFLLKQSTASTVRLSTMKFDACKWVIVNGAFSLAYNVDLKSWMLMNNSAGVTPWIVTHSDSTKTYGINTTSDTDSNGKIYFLDYDSFQDGSSNYEFRYVSPRLDMGTENQKRLHKLRLIGDKQSSETSVDISWSDDDYNTFTTARAVDMSSNRPYITQCGSFRRRAFKLSYTGSNPLRIQALELDFTFGAH